jgi:hypothetical protein
VSFSSDFDPVTQAPIQFDFDASDFRLLEPGSTLFKLAVKGSAKSSPSPLQMLQTPMPQRKLYKNRMLVNPRGGKVIAGKTLCRLPGPHFRDGVPLISKRFCSHRYTMVSVLMERLITVASLARHVEVVVGAASMERHMDVILRGAATGAAQGVAQGVADIKLCNRLIQCLEHHLQELICPRPRYWLRCQCVILPMPSMPMPSISP